MAYWNGTAWVKNYDSGFAAVTEAELNTWAADALYSVDTIEDTVNLGINYIVKVGEWHPGTGKSPSASSRSWAIRRLPARVDDECSHRWGLAAGFRHPRHAASYHDHHQR